MPLKPRAYIDIGDKPFGGKGSSPCILGEIDCFFSIPHNTSSTLHALPMGWYCPAKKYMNSTFKLHREVDQALERRKGQLHQTAALVRSDDVCAHEQEASQHLHELPPEHVGLVLAVQEGDGLA